jgi:hypothetical protein
MLWGVKEKASPRCCDSSFTANMCLGWSDLPTVTRAAQARELDLDCDLVCQPW